MLSYVKRWCFWLSNTHFCWITWCFPNRIYNLKNHMSGPRGSAPASVPRFAPLSGLRSAPRARRCTPVWFFNFPTHREKKSRYQQKSPRYQANPRYSAKNNVAMRMIATFMPIFFIYIIIANITFHIIHFLKHYEILILISIRKRFSILWDFSDLCLLYNKRFPPYLLLPRRLSDYFTMR